LRAGKGQEESSFFEKKEAKKLYSFGPRGHAPSRDGFPNSAAPSHKSFFASFFSKKEDSCRPPFCCRQ
jgi:hypothetical protein